VSGSHYFFGNHSLSISLRDYPFDPEDQPEAFKKRLRLQFSRECDIDFIAGTRICNLFVRRLRKTIVVKTTFLVRAEVKIGSPNSTSLNVIMTDIYGSTLEEKRLNRFNDREWALFKPYLSKSMARVINGFGRVMTRRALNVNRILGRMEGDAYDKVFKYLYAFDLQRPSHTMLLNQFSMGQPKRDSSRSRSRSPTRYRR
jgi:hypothetical protein